MLEFEINASCGKGVVHESFVLVDFQMAGVIIIFTHTCNKLQANFRLLVQHSFEMASYFHLEGENNDQT